MDDQATSATTLQASYIAACILVAVLVHKISWLDLRSLKRLSERYRRGAGTAEPISASASAPDLFERPDLGAMLSLLVIIGTALAALIGWRIPAEIERLYGAGASFGILFPSVEMTTIGRAAQVVGAICFGLVALRLLRVLVWFAAAGLACTAGAGAVSYVFELNLFGFF